MNESKYFKESEFTCKCGCGFVVWNPALLHVLEAVRKHFGKRIVINSGCRCREYNKKVKGAPNSQHLKGYAADFVVKGTPSQEVFRFLDTFEGGNWGLAQIGKTSTHVDVRGYHARWTYS